MLLKKKIVTNKKQFLPMLELRLLFGFAKVTTGKNNFSCKQKGNLVYGIMTFGFKDYDTPLPLSPLLSVI